MKPQVGYCTNVHAGAGLAQTRANLERHALAVKRAVSSDAPMGVGLWLSSTAARQLREERAERAWADWLAEVGLVPFTLNGFPFGDFHQKVVKHDVYLPTWAEPARLEYTLDLIHIQHALLPSGLEGSISTLPILWGTPAPAPEVLRVAAANLRRVADELVLLEKRTGRLIYVCLEPEPGCVLQRSEDVVRFFEGFLLPGGDEKAIRRHLRVCHDVCHQVVMFEDQAEVLARYRQAGIGVGKVQVSSAVCLNLETTAPAERAAALAQLGGFAEDRYLHQTVVRPTPDATPTFYEDLPLALKTAGDAGEWRVHFHVPVYLERFGRLETSQGAILECLRAAAGDTHHWEVETYAWGVLPAELRQADLATGIAQEMRWFRRALGCPPRTGLVTATSHGYNNFQVVLKGTKIMKAPKVDVPVRLHEVEEEFVQLWRTMSSLWGISPTMAEIHGLLFITGHALSMDGIIERLKISRGNVSMNLSKLLEWGLVRKVHKRGDRREYYESIGDVWEMFTLVASQRKRREVDPILATLKKCHESLSPESLGAGAEDDEVRERSRRVHDLLAFFTLLDSLAQRFFESREGLREAVGLLAQDETAE